jgi:hypothetical protein
MIGKSMGAGPEQRCYEVRLVTQFSDCAHLKETEAAQPSRVRMRRSYRASPLPMLRAPDGRSYPSDDEVEARDLVLGHDYVVVPDEPPGEPAESRGRQTKSLASVEYSETTDEGETTH